MSIIRKIKNNIRSLFTNSENGMKVMKLMTDEGDSGYFIFDGNIYHSDIVRSAVRPLANAVGKAVGKHIRKTIDKDGEENIAVNPEPYIRFILEEPNPYMTGQELQERLAAQLALNNNAFALLVRDKYGYPEQIYPITAHSVIKRYDKERRLFLDFQFPNGTSAVFPYDDIIHLRDDFYTDDVFGTPIHKLLIPLMEVIQATDKGIVKAIKNSAVIRWLLTYMTSLREDDLKKNAKAFAENYISIESESLGVAATDSKAKVEQIKNTEYIPPTATVKSTCDRIYKIFNTNEKIVSSQWNEDEWNAYFESKVEPVILKLQNAYTSRLFSRRERGCGNSIVFESFNLSTASMATKLSLREMVDRRAMRPNEWRAAFNMAPVPGGNKLLQRKDTGTVGGDDFETDDRDNRNDS